MRRFTSTLSLNFTRVAPPSPPTPSIPVVFLHGLLGSSTNFRTLQLATALTRDTLALDLRNHGRSPHAPGPAPLSTLAADVAATLSSACAPAPAARFDVVGHSLGGKVAMALALRHPSLVRRLIVVDIAPVAYNAASNPGWASVQGVVRAASALQPAGYGTRREVEAALAAAVPEPGVRSFVAQNLVPQPGGGFSWRVGWEGILASLPLYAGWGEAGAAGGAGEAAAAAVEPLDGASVHFIRGAESSYVLPRHEPAIRALFPSAQLHTIEGAGHWVHADKPAEFGALLAKLLE